MCILAAGCFGDGQEFAHQWQSLFKALKAPARRIPRAKLAVVLQAGRGEQETELFVILLARAIWPQVVQVGNKLIDGQLIVYSICFGLEAEQLQVLIFHDEICFLIEWNRKIKNLGFFAKLCLNSFLPWFKLP